MFKQTGKVFGTVKEFKEFLRSTRTMPTQFNRPLKESHVKEMINSVETIALQREINVIKTKAFGEGNNLYIADGQHLKSAILSLPDRKIAGVMNARINYYNSTEEIVLYVSKMNSTAKNWSLKNYLNAWVTVGKPDYIFLRDKCAQEDLGLGGMITAYLGREAKGNTVFKQGQFKANYEVGDRIVKLYRDATALGLRPINSSFLGLVRFYVRNPKLNVADFLNGINENSELFGKKMSAQGYITTFGALCI